MIIMMKKSYLPAVTSYLWLLLMTLVIQYLSKDYVCAKARHNAVSVGIEVRELFGVSWIPRDPAVPRGVRIVNSSPVEI